MRDAVCQLLGDVKGNADCCMRINYEKLLELLPPVARLELECTSGQGSVYDRAGRANNAPQIPDLLAGFKEERSEKGKKDIRRYGRKGMDKERGDGRNDNGRRQDRKER